MLKLVFIFLFLFFLILNPSFILASNNSFVSIVNPIRGLDFWEEKNQNPGTAVFGQMEILDKFDMTATWLIRYDAFSQTEIIQRLKETTTYEKGIFLEITPTWAKDANINYHQSENWHSAGSAFLSGYERDERVKLIDTAFEKFKSIFGFYPKSVGAWWIDAFSLSYMQEKFGVVAALIVSDQYTTDNYQIWGQFWSTPYFPSKKNALHPAQNSANKLPVVITQWALRDPVNGYGKGVEESTFSLQANDYLDYHNLDSSYFSSLVDIYTKQKFNQFGHITAGLENSYSWEKYSGEYQKQIEILDQKSKQGQFSIFIMEDFANWYKNKFAGLSPPQVIVADDPLGSDKKVVWFMNPYYRVGWFYTGFSGASSAYHKDGSVIRDIRQYIEGEEEICFIKRCDEVNFGTTATRVLDEVSFGHKYILDEGEISDLKIIKEGEKLQITYNNQAGNERAIEFLPRDINVDGKISSIDTLILDNTLKHDEILKSREIKKGFFEWSPLTSVFKISKFLLFLIVGCLVPGYLFIGRLFKKSSFLKQAAASIILGFVFISLLSYILGLLNLKPLIFMYLFINLIILVKERQVFKRFFGFQIKSLDFSVAGLILAGTIFQQLPAFKNGLIFPYGVGLWGPNTHDGMWHISLINQLVKSVPAQNPIFAGETLKNYHYFYDLLIAITNYISGIPVLDLVFRFYPILFSLLLGTLSYFLIQTFFKQESTNQKSSTLFALFLVYFAGSFGWIVEFIKTGKFLGGESAFWANQSISFNLNPPFAISLLICIVIFLILQGGKFNKITLVVLTILAGSLISFKAYGAILIIASFLVTGILKRSLPFLLVFLTSSIIALTLFLSNFSINKQLIIFSPFWFIHSMIDSPDRVGWVRLSLARTAGLETGNWFKFVTVETISFLIFLIGNLGTRVFALLSLFGIKYIVRRVDYLFISVFSTLAFIIPVLFIQVGNPWNTIQFLYYFLYISAILGGLVFAKFISKIGRPIAAIATICFLIITPISSWSSAKGYLTYQPHALISKEELEALRFLESKEEGIVLTYPYDPRLKKSMTEPWPLSIYDSTAYVSALSGKAVFVEDEGQNQILLTNYEKRLAITKDFFVSPYLNGSQFLKRNNIKYIFLSKIHKLGLDEKRLNIKVIFENQEVIVYKLI